MSLNVTWYDNEHTILVATIAKDTTWTEYNEAIDRIITEASQVDHRVDVIFYDEVGMPAGNPIPHIQWGMMTLSKQNNIKSTFIAGSRGSSGFARTLMEAVGQVFIRRLQTSGQRFGGFKKTLDETVACIQADRVGSEQAVTNESK